MSTPLDRALTAPASLRNRLSYWLPPILWMAVIFWCSTDTFSAEHTSTWLEWVCRWVVPHLSHAQCMIMHFYVRKAAHFSIYAILAGLLMRAFCAGAWSRWRFQWMLSSFFIVSLYALLDEYHQSFTWYRTASPYDSFLDMAGGGVSLLVLWLVRLWKTR
jgi:VanZ family protein